MVEMTKVNIDAVCESLVCGRVLSNSTFSKDKKHNVEHPKIDYSYKYKVDYKKSCYFVEKFKESIEKSCKGKDTIALALSGGKDSRVLVTFLKEYNPVCITWSYSKNDSEVKVAEKICKKLNLKHKHIPISPNLYFNSENAEMLLKLADGSPIYFDMMLWYGIKDQLDHDVVFCGNLMTEYMDTAEYRVYEGTNVCKALFGKETLINILEPNHHIKTITKLNDFYFNTFDMENVIMGRMFDRVVQYHVMKNFINWEYPMLDPEVQKELFRIKFHDRSGSRLTRYILRDYAPDLYKMPTARSPLSLKYPLWVHQGYQKVSGRKISKGLENLLPNYLDKFNSEFIEHLPDRFFFINKNKVRKFLKSETGRTKRMGQTRMLNLLKWSDKKWKK